VGSIPTSPTKFVLIEACQKLIDHGPNCQGPTDPEPLTGREPCGLLVTVEVMLLEGWAHGLFIVLRTFKHQAVLHSI